MTEETCNCIECDAQIEIERKPLMGEILVCKECGVELEVINNDPIKVEMAPEVEEDWGE